MVASALIIAVSFVLLLYWFRYTCLLLLDGSPASQHAGRVARTNRLRFLEVQEALGTGAPLDALQRSLDSDYRILVYLLEHSTALDVPGFEQQFMVMDYRVMQLWYRVVRRFSESHARQALLEMSRVLGYFCQKMGERAAQHAAA